MIAPYGAQRIPSLTQSWKYDSWHPQSKSKTPLKSPNPAPKLIQKHRDQNTSEVLLTKVVESHDRSQDPSHNPKLQKNKHGTWMHMVIFCPKLWETVPDFSRPCWPSLGFCPNIVCQRWALGVLCRQVPLGASAGREAWDWKRSDPVLGEHLKTPR